MTVLQAVGQYLLLPIFNIEMPILGCTYGQFIVAIFGLPIAVGAIRKLVSIST